MHRKMHKKIKTLDFHFLRKPQFGKQLISAPQAERHLGSLLHHKILPNTAAFWRKSKTLDFLLKAVFSF